MRLWLSEDLARTLIQNALSAAPSEACGIVAGVGERAQKVLAAINTAQDPLHQFRIDDRFLAEMLFGLAPEGMEIVAFYHSHPRGDARPSALDAALAAYPDIPHLIVGLGSGRAQMAAWHLRRQEVTPVELCIGGALPENADEPLTADKKSVILLSAAIAVIFMIILSLSLLPPAPPLP